MKRIFLPGLLSAMLLLTPSAYACPVCNQGTGKQVRAGIFDEDFGFNLFATVLPFLVLLGIAAVVHFGLPRRRVVTPKPNPEPTAEIV